LDLREGEYEFKCVFGCLFIFSAFAEFSGNYLATFLSSIRVVTSKSDDCMVADAELVCDEVSGSEYDELSLAHDGYTA